MKSFVFIFPFIFPLFSVIGIVFSNICIHDADINEFWEDFKKMYRKKYAPEEEPKKKLIWEQNLADILLHNIKADLGYFTYTNGLNEYADMSFDEYRDSLNGYKKDPNINTNGSNWVPPHSYATPNDLDIDLHIHGWTPRGPANRVMYNNGLYKRGLYNYANPWSSFGPPLKMDWRDYGLVTPVKNQGPCNACWAFSATGALEAQLKRKTGYLTPLSEQNLVDCITENGGCFGGWMNHAFEYVQTYGIVTESVYPYTGMIEKCFYQPSKVYAMCQGYYKINSGNENALMLAVATVGPISAAIDSQHKSFHFYKSGIYDNPECKQDANSHAVLVVGYGTEDGIDYWLIKNSWGVSWGMNGYMKLLRNRNNQCGIATVASFPVV